MKKRGIIFASGIGLAIIAFVTLAPIIPPPPGPAAAETDPIYLAAKDTDGTLAANSDAKVATQKAAKTYSDTKQTAAQVQALIDAGGFAPTNNPVFTGTAITGSGSLLFGSDGTYAAGSISADANWGIILRAKTAGSTADVLFTNSAGSELMRLDPNGASVSGRVFATGTSTFPAINGGSAANDDITIQGTSNGTRTTSYVNLQPNGGNVGIGTTDIGNLLTLGGSAYGDSALRKTLEFNPGGFASPGAFNTASNGDKIILYRSASGGYDSAIGIDDLGNTWFKSFSSTGGVYGGFKWFTGTSTTAHMGIDGSGNVSVPVSLTVGTGGSPIALIKSATATLDFGSTTAQTSSELTIAVTGAAVGDECLPPGLPASPDANTSFTSYVSATDTVTIRFNNYSSGAVDPASGTYRAGFVQF